VKPANVDSDLTPLQSLRLCLDCQKLLSKGKKPVNADFRFYSPDPRLMELSELERRLIFPVNPSMRIFRLLADGQYGTSGGSVIHINDCLRVAQKLPSLPTNADVLFVRQSGQSRAQLEKMVKIRPNHLRNLLREVRTPATCPAAVLSPVYPFTPTFALVNYPALSLQLSFRRVNQTELRDSTAESFESPFVS